jgi:hypothetical protein
MIRAILENGLIRPAEPIPPDWQDGQELVVDRRGSTSDPADIDRWAREMDEGAQAITAEDAVAFERALVDVERESKDAVRREWGLP